jgi:tRNA 2-thiouridine synthesizing protein A
MTTPEPDATIDLRGTPCPLNWVKTKLRLERMQPGQVLEVVVDDGAPARNVPRSVEAEGHRVLAMTNGAGRVRILIQRQ